MKRLMVVALMFVSVVALSQPSSSLFYGQKDLNFNILDFDSLRVWQTERNGHGLWWQHDATKDCYFLRTDTVGLKLWYLDVSVGTWASPWEVSAAGAMTFDSLYVRALKSTGSLTLATVTCDTNAFTTTAAHDTVAVTGAATTDKYIVTLRHLTATTGADSIGALSVMPTATGFIVSRDTTANKLQPGAKYTWLRIK